MAKPRKEDQDMEETRRIMERLVKMPHKSHDDSKIGKRKSSSPSKESRKSVASKKGGRRPSKSG